MQPSYESVQRSVQHPWKPGVDLRLSLVRDSMRLPWRSGGEELSTSEVLNAARGVNGRPGALLIGGGDPLRRRDLFELVAELVRLRPDNLGLCTAGHGVSGAMVQQLRALGVQRMQVPFHCARQYAHDWLVGQPGALKAALRAIRICIEIGMPVTAEVVLIRPTMPHLAETVDVLARVGVRAICIRRLTAHDVDASAFVSLSPRLSLLAADLERAATVALERRVRVIVRDLPVCAAPRLRPLFAKPGSEAWVTADGTLQTRAEAGTRCASCADTLPCAGAPADYVSRFGWHEFAEPEPSALRVGENVAAQQTPRLSGTMVFSWQGPRRVRCDSCADRPDDEWARNLESTRRIRARLVEAARHRPAVLQLVGADLLAHPNAALLIYDALRLFPHVECAGEASAAVDWSDLDLRRMKDLRRIDVALYGPDASKHDGHCGIPGAFAATLRGVERLREQTTIAIGAYAIVHDARWVPLFAEAWSRGDLPGEPRFRLSARGSSLDDLVECARGLPPGPARSALVAVLPRCLTEQAGLTVPTDLASAASMAHQRPQVTVVSGRRADYAPCGSDPIGGFASCSNENEACPVADCPGTPLGWQQNARSGRWTADI
jgi:MoaA/NifB/PqqE/SkfB family radical SAM enzyme